MKTDVKIIDYSHLEKLKRELTKKGKISVLTTGCYDILHLGHVIHLSYCKSKGDVLIVSVGCDESVKLLKGSTRPINNQEFRARMVAALACVDYVIISRELGKMDHNKIVRLLKPNIYIVPSSDSCFEEKKRLVTENGGKFISCRRLPPAHLNGGISTTDIETKMKE